MPPGSYSPYVPARRPGGAPPERPRYRLLVHRQYAHLWAQLAGRVGLESARQCYEHLTTTPGAVARVNRTAILKGRYARPIAEGFSPTIHYEVSGAGRVDYQFNNAYVGSSGDPHPVVFILRIDLGSH